MILRDSAVEMIVWDQPSVPWIDWQSQAMAHPPQHQGWVGGCSLRRRRFARRGSVAV